MMQHEIKWCNNFLNGVQEDKTILGIVGISKFGNSMHLMTLMMIHRGFGSLFEYDEIFFSLN